MAINPEHKKWADLVVKGESDIDAYIKLFPTSTRKNAANITSRWRKKEEILTYLRKKSSKISSLVENKLEKEVSSLEVSNILTSAKKREILAKIVSGEFETEKYVTIKGELKKVKVKPDINDIMKAIELDNKMAGDNVQAKPNQVAKAEEVTKVVVVEDETESPKK